MSTLEKLLAACQCGVYITVNQHRNYYESVEIYLAAKDELADIDVAVLAQMMATNMIVEVQAYPKTPIGFCVVYHYEIEAALEKALACSETY